MEKLQFLPLGAGQAAVFAGAAVAFRLLDPLADRSLGQVKVPRDLADGPVTLPAQANDLGLELRCE